ncbi:MAG TPA: glycosyltransferase family 4 protein [Sedimentibacter sp.]|nr:glycosyltransferase family 4 protein [Sedimentibacter sp.]
MKILIAVHTYYPDKNGVQGVTQYIAEGLAKNHEVKVVTQLRNGYLKDQVHSGVSIKRIKVKKIRFWFFGEKHKYTKLITDYDADVFICVCIQSWTSDWTIHKVKKIKGMKILYTHGYSALKKEYSIKTAIRNLSIGKIVSEIYWSFYYSNIYKYINKYDLVTYLSEHDQSVWYAKEHKLSNGIILGNAVEDEFFAYSILDEKSRFTSHKELVYLNVANYFEYKNQELAMEAFYKAKLRNCKMIFLGNEKTKYYDRLIKTKAKCEKKYGIRNVELLYGKSRDEVFEIYKNADVCIVSSKIEAFPISICEAMTLGMSLISTDVGSVATLPGITIVNNQEEMIEAMLDLYHDPDKRIENGIKSREYAIENFASQTKIEALEHEIKSYMTDLENR